MAGRAFQRDLLSHSVSVCWISSIDIFINTAVDPEMCQCMQDPMLTCSGVLMLVKLCSIQTHTKPAVMSAQWKHSLEFLLHPHICPCMHTYQCPCMHMAMDSVPMFETLHSDPSTSGGPGLGGGNKETRVMWGFFCYASAELMLKPLLPYENPESPPPTEGQFSLVASQSWGSPNCSLG